MDRNYGKSKVEERSKIKNRRKSREGDEGKRRKVQKDEASNRARIWQEEVFNGNGNKGR